ncbi:hypothetical protein QWA68_015088 [Fusarium oxysporum]|nr:hypothetical protein QWA68_015088 [Fusarium oxysporum]
MAKNTFSNDEIEKIISQLDLTEKITLLTGRGRCALNGIKRLDIPVIHTSDGPHGLRGGNFFNVTPGVQLPSAVGLGATFDVDLLRTIGTLLGDEAVAKNKHVILAPTVCIQRSPLIGRGFEAFGEDPILSGTLAGHYINGIQSQGIAACIKHYAAHDQSEMSIEDDIRMTERTLREIHLLPFQVAMKLSKPLAVMTAYNKINGIHASEDSFLMNQVLRQEWGFEGLIMSDWWGTYSTSEAINAGLDLEMPGPSVWRGKALAWAVESRKVSQRQIDQAVRRVLQLIAQTWTTRSSKPDGNNDTLASKAIARQAATDSIVLLKNDAGILPLNSRDKKKYALIGDHFRNPATAGGGSSEATPYYVSKPYDAIVAKVGIDNVTEAIGSYSHRFTPLLWSELRMQGSGEPGLFVELFATNPSEDSTAKCLWTAETTKSLLQFTDSIPENLPESHFIRITTVFTAPKTAKFRFGLSCFGKAVMKLDGRQVIDLWTDHPGKTDITPVFNAFSMERFHDVHVTEGQEYHIEILLSNVFTGPVIGIAPSGGIRLGGCEVLDEQDTISQAVQVAKQVDIPIILTGLSSDYEMESADRKDLSLPGRLDELIERVSDANPNTIVVTQSGMPISMPWHQKVNTLIHAWYGGQETGNAIADILFGYANPSGRLSVSFPRHLRDTPSFLNFGKSDHQILYGEGVFVGYRYYEKLENPPLFYFGHGLSYTQFEYRNLCVPDEFEAHKDHIMNISMDIHNMGKVTGAEVVQVYIADAHASVRRPKKELKAFSKVMLQAGEVKTINVQLDRQAVSFWSMGFGAWRAEAGTFRVIVSRSADPRDEILEAEFSLSNTFTWNGV